MPTIPVSRRGSKLGVHGAGRPRSNFAASPQDFEAIVAEHQGRPHWGKLHSLHAARLRELYPRFDDFRRIRDQLDPGRTFTNDYLDRVLGS